MQSAQVREFSWQNVHKFGKGRHSAVSYRQECSFIARGVGGGELAAAWKWASGVTYYDPASPLVRLMKDLVHLDSALWRGHRVDMNVLNAKVESLLAQYRQSVQAA